MLQDDPMDHIENPTALMALVRTFIDDHGITCPESIYQTDKIIEDAYELIEAMCEASGYAPRDDDDLFDDEDAGQDDYYDNED